MKVERVEIGPHVLILGDALRVLPTFPSQCADAVVTDPPYGVGFSRATWPDDPDQYGNLISTAVREFNRIIVDGWVFVFQGMPNCGRFHEWFPNGWRLFASCKNFVQIRPNRIWHAWDPVVFWSNGPCRRPFARINRDYFVANTAVRRRDKSHPCPKPIDAMLRIVEMSCAEGGCVLDPFMGQASTGIAAVALGRRFIGIEIDRRHFRKAVAAARDAVRRKDAGEELAVGSARKDIAPRPRS
ncbi:MAG: site-specific DNA-methyltransferase [Lentisphaeria bacterium]